MIEALNVFANHSFYFILECKNDFLHFFNSSVLMLTCCLIICDIVQPIPSQSKRNRLQRLECFCYLHPQPLNNLKLEAHKVNYTMTVLLILKVNIFFCHNSANINTLIPAEIKHGLYVISQYTILDLIPSSTQYNFAKPQQTAVEHNIGVALMKICFQTNIKVGISTPFIWLRLQVPGAGYCIGMVTDSQCGIHREAHVPLLMWLLCRAIRGR